METFYWFDFETFGTHPAKDRPCQFAGIRTDRAFNIIGKPLNIFCKPANDNLPHPEACLITGITPQQAMEQGVCESEFFDVIYQQLAQPQTCNLGYNSIRFDDEVIRYGLYRNFFDVYGREWQNGNSRWDILDMLRMTHALRPEGIEWPLNEDGNPSFRLELLTKANHLSHENAHDALADVYATIAMAKLVKQQQPKLYQFLYNLRLKANVAKLINLQNHQLLVHCSGMLGPEHQYTGIMMPIMQHPSNNNSYICINLLRDFADLADLDVEAIKLRLFTRQQDLPEGIPRLAIKEIHINKSPAIAPMNVLTPKTQQRLNISIELCQQRAATLLSFIDRLKTKLQQIYSEKNFETSSNPDYGLYSGGFFSAKDKAIMSKIRTMDWSQLAKTNFSFDDNRLETLLFRYRARNCPDSLTPQQLVDWNQFRHQQLLTQESDLSINFYQLKQRIEQLQKNSDNDLTILQNISEYAQDLVSDLKCLSG